MAPPSKGGGELVDGELKSLIETQYGSFDSFKTTLANATVGVQGSGWVWLGYDKVNKRLAITTTANQDPLEATTGLVPLFGIDVWEHAYYLQVRWSTSLLIQLSPHSYRDVQRISSNMNIIKCIYTW